MSIMGSPSVFVSATGTDRFHQTREASTVVSRATTGLMFSPNSGSDSSPVSQRTQYGSACPNLISLGSGNWSRGTPDNCSSTCHTACSAYSATASPSRGLSQIPFPVLRRIPSVGTSAPSQTDQGAAPSSAAAGNCAYRRMPETSSVHHTPGTSPALPPARSRTARAGPTPTPAPPVPPPSPGPPRTPATGGIHRIVTRSSSARFRGSGTTGNGIRDRDLYG
jgi:hypothetical protein